MDTEVSSILQLNDDCLWCIFTYLDLPELLIAGSVCQRFEGIAQMFYKNFQSVDFCQLDDVFKKKDIRYPELGEVWRKIEPYMIAMKIHDLSYEKNFGRSGFPITKFQNLQHLFLGGLGAFENVHEEYAQIFPALKQIVLYGGGFYINECALNRWFKNSHQLKILKFIENEYLTGECFVGLKGIEELTIYRCDKIEDRLFEQFCQMNPQLKKLSLHWYIVPDYAYNFLGNIVKYLKNLESLVITNFSRGKRGVRYEHYEILRDLPKITKLRLENDSKTPCILFDNMLGHFATNNHHIEYLSLFVYDGLLNIIQQFSYLKVLKLTDLRISFEKLSNFLSCSETLEELHFYSCYLKTIVDLKNFIQKFKSLKLLNVYRWYDLKPSLLMNIEECLYNRSQKLEIEVEEAFFGPDLYKDIKTRIFKNFRDFLDRTKKTFKFTIITDDAKLAKIRKSYVEYEWEGKVEGEEEFFYRIPNYLERRIAVEHILSRIGERLGGNVNIVNFVSENRHKSLNELDKFF